jgi:tRNA G18 (ribose-2'-O)-methylase SpoU
VNAALPESAFSHLRHPEWLTAHGWFVAEGRHVTRRLLQSPYRTAAILVTPVAHDAMLDAISTVDPSRRPAVFIRSPAEMDALTGFRLHQGCVALAERQPLPDWRVMPRQPGVAVCLEHVRDPDNVGSIARSAAALGATCVLVGPGCADPLYRKAIRTSMGALLTFPVLDASMHWPGALVELKAGGAFVIAATPDADTDISAMTPTGTGSRVVLLLGSEGEGLSEAALSAADIRVRIPMASGTDSLNVAVAAAVALFALTAQVRPWSHDDHL